jgi:GTPase
MFVDQIKVYARAGHGGKGCVAFQREAYRPKGGPSGGNGGRGGAVILEADHDLNNLVAQFYAPRLIAENGEHGLGKGMDGHAGKDRIVKVPCGTLVWKLPEQPAAQKEAEEESEEESEEHPPLPRVGDERAVMRFSTGARAMEIDLSNEGEEELESEEEGDAAEREIPRASSQGKGELVADLTEHGQRVVLCKGGRGGLGNRNFATATRQTPRFAQPGEPGEEGNYLLELRLIADVGLVGYPNAGKSTLLTAISKARPKVAAYPFTTLHPKIGIVEYPDFVRVVVCDVPGLIAGAHQNVGLGHSFLRHIERCKILVLLIDMAGEDGRAPWEDYKQLLQELELYNPGLLEKPRLVVANKMDESAAGDNLKKFKRRITKTKVLPIAAAFDEGIEEFKQKIRDAVEAEAAKGNQPGAE